MQGVAGPVLRWRLPLMAVITLAWLSMAVMALQHQDIGVHATHHIQFDLVDLLLMLAMWWGMAIAMMLPTAIPALNTLEEIRDTARRKGDAVGRSSLFVLGFVAVWFGFGIVASVAQYAMHNWMLLTPDAKSSSQELSAALFVCAGLYQWTPLKEACVSKCRSPMSFFLSYWEEGSRGFWRMGLRMGKYCLGCCWAMMLLMFTLGVMNLLWMGLLALYMFVEKNWIQQPWFDRATGIVLIAAGVLMLVLPRIT